MANTSFQTPLFRPLTPTEAATFYSLVITGVIGGIGTLILAQAIKNKTEIPVKDLALWTGIFGAVTLISVLSIARASK